MHLARTRKQTDVYDTRRNNHSSGSSSVFPRPGGGGQQFWVLHPTSRSMFTVCAYGMEHS